MATTPEFPARDDVNWQLLQGLYSKPHPLIRVTPEVTGGLHFGLVELLHEVQAAHHLLDLIGVPHGYSMDTRAIDCRVLLAVRAVMTLRERLDRISGWHAREAGPAGTVGDYCTECGHRWPCDTRRMADGTYTGERGTVMKRISPVLAAIALVSAVSACQSSSSRTVVVIPPPASTSSQLTSAAPATPCAPRTPAGNCYVPGQSCPKADYGKSGTDAAGVKIICKDVRGWHWVAA